MNRLALALNITALLIAAPLFAADPTFLRRSLSEVQPQSGDLTANARLASYKPLFGAGDAQANQLKGIARYGELTVAPGGASAIVSYPNEEQIYYILEGTGTLLYADRQAPVRKNDFMYLLPGVRHGVANASSQPLRLLVMGYKLRDVHPAGPPPELQLANAGDVHAQQLGQHGPTVQFKLLMGTTESKRDKLAAAHKMVSLFIMDFAPGGTNIPHHHDMEEEIYFVLQGHGDMVAGGGADGNEGRYPARAGDAFFIRLNATVGFYSGSREGEPHDMVLAVRSTYPFSPGPR
jgi:mannose-6-phosphate isomerase-like protein (cupin superfamily)